MLIQNKCEKNVTAERPRVTPIFKDRLPPRAGSGIPRGLTSHVCALSGGLCLLLLVRLPSQLQHQRPESLWTFYQPDASKSLQVNLESENSVGAKAKQSMM